MNLFKPEGKLDDPHGTTVVLGFLSMKVWLQLIILLMLCGLVSFFFAHIFSLI